MADVRECVHGSFFEFPSKSYPLHKPIQAESLMSSFLYSKKKVYDPCTTMFFYR